MEPLFTLSLNALLALFCAYQAGRFSRDLELMDSDENRFVHWCLWAVDLAFAVYFIISLIGLLSGAAQ